MNGLQYSVSVWLPVVIFPQTMAPTFRRGFPGTFGLVISGLIIIVCIKLLADRDVKRAVSPLESNNSQFEDGASIQKEDSDYEPEKSVVEMVL